MEPSDVAGAIEAARSIVTGFGLPVGEAVVLQNSNRLAARLLPVDLVARVAFGGRDVAALEMELARCLTEVGAPCGALDPRAGSGPHEWSGFVVTLWTYYEPIVVDLPAAGYARALERLHAGLRQVSVDAPRFTDRVADAEKIVVSRSLAPELADADRALLVATLRRLRERIVASGAPEQLLHGEPHAGNVLGTMAGPVFVDLETCCTGPVEFDLAHVPARVGAAYPGVDRGLLDDCRQLVLAMVAAWRWERGDQLPDGKRFGRELLHALRAGPPWPTLDDLFGRPVGPPSGAPR